jgi:erythromycin esterase-like protein
MRQNLVDIEFAADAVADIEHALDTLDQRFAALVGLTPRQRRHLTKMGGNSEAFCRQALQMAHQHPELMPRSFDNEASLRDLRALEQLRDWRTQLTRLYERMADTETALGSDLMTAALEAYAFLKVAGQREGLDTTKRELATRFARSPRRGSATNGSEPTAGET